MITANRKGETMIIAMMTRDHTPCEETALCHTHDTPANRQFAEQQACRPYYEIDRAMPKSWTDCTACKILVCMFCGHQPVVCPN